MPLDKEFMHLFLYTRSLCLFFQDEHYGIINISMNLKHIVDRWAAFVQQITQDKYGHAPEIRISGHVNSKFPYIEMPLDYILPELLKNAVRATMEAHPGSKGKNLPPIYVTIANNPTDFIIKISDRGGGIRHDRFVEKKGQLMQFAALICFQGLESYAVQFFYGRRKHGKSFGERHFRQHFGRMQSNNEWAHVRLWLWIAYLKSLCGIFGRILEINVDAGTWNGRVSQAKTFQFHRRVNVQNLNAISF